MPNGANETRRKVKEIEVYAKSHCSTIDAAKVVLSALDFCPSSTRLENFARYMINTIINDKVVRDLENAFMHSGSG